MFLCSLPRLSSASISSHLDMEHSAPSCLLLSCLSNWLQIIMSQSYFTNSFSSPEKCEAHIVCFTSMLSYNLLSTYPMFNRSSYHFSKETYRLSVMKCIHPLMLYCYSSVCLNIVPILDWIITSNFFHFLRFYLTEHFPSEVFL